MLTTGAWRVAERGNCYVVVEISRQSAYAYLWDKKEGVRSHVWLFNCDAERASEGAEDDDGAGPAMSSENVISDLPVPSSVDEISCVYNITDGTWDLFWAGKKMAALSEDERPGRSLLVKNCTDLAKPFESLGNDRAL